MNKRLLHFSDKQLAEKFESAWRKLMKRDKPTSQDNKTAFVLGGQPGSGKSSSAEKIKQEFLNGNCIFISSDDFKKYHPKYKEINKNFHSQVHEYTKEFVSKMVQLTMKRAAEKNYNVIVERTFKSTKTPLSTLEQLKQNGYKTGVAIIACPKELSWLSTIERYKKERQTGGDGRVVSKEAHDYAVSVLSDNAQTVYNQKQAYDIFAVYRRDANGANLIYNSKTDKEFDKKIIENVLNDKSISRELALKNQKSVNLDFSKSLSR
jgi:predicted ABC-type ATPase